jgi:glycosyltransferase involved in cell wall biosynthesis
MVKNKIKIIHILHHSPSWTSKNIEEDIFDGWHAQTARALEKEVSFEAIFECWVPEKTIYQEQSVKKDNILYRVFPSKALGYGREISNSLIRALKNEAENYLLIIHLHGIFNYHTYLIAHYFRNLPIIAQHHGEAPPICLLERRKTLAFVTPLLLGEQLIALKVLNHIDHFFCLTQKCLKILTKMGIKSSKSTQTMGVDFSTIKKIHKADAKIKLGFSANDKILLYVGRLTSYKGADKLIRVAKELKNLTDIKVVIVGADPSDEYYSQAEAAGLKIFPRLAHNLLISYYQASDIFILPGSPIYNEWGGIGIATIEALACNTPVISGTLKHFPGDYKPVGIRAQEPSEIIKAVQNILQNPHQTQNYCLMAQQYYDWKVIAQNTIALYKKLLSRYYNLKI